MENDAEAGDWFFRLGEMEGNVVGNNSTGRHDAHEARRLKVEAFAGVRSGNF